MSPKVTEAYREKTRNEIVLAAEKVFARKGYNGASMDDIVRESGLSKGALYGYFRSKEDLFLALRARRIDFNLEQFLAAMPATASVMERLTKAGQVALKSQARLDRDTLRIGFEFFASSSRIPALKGYYNEIYHDNQRLLVALIREGMARGEFRKDLDPESVAWILMAVVDGLGLHAASLTTGVDFDWDAVSETFLSMVSNGILATSKRSRPA